MPSLLRTASVEPGSVGGACPSFALRLTTTLSSAPSTAPGTPVFDARPEIQLVTEENARTMGLKKSGTVTVKRTGSSCTDEEAPSGMAKKLYRAALA
eukprot:CAMPEP_0185551400 /NCGR_PEP_ID=MMETSP1381-20130426/24558_1 /TAXON_ID=298111 /ORGANISM="Pavlova sp., Strain CCMP459" /LENGTH=96 /DNA_ID=CAMNT_0028164261 /DNA_START=423 /DNA_END=710 /DNA_ORIENTATION=+